MKICPARAELFHAYRRTDRYDEANSRFYAILRNRLKSERRFAIRANSFRERKFTDNQKDQTSYMKINGNEISAVNFLYKKLNCHEQKITTSQLKTSFG